MTSDVSEFFFVGSRGNLANYVVLFKVHEPRKTVLEGENKGGHTLVKLAQPLKSYLPVQILTAVNYTQK